MIDALSRRLNALPDVVCTPDAPLAPLTTYKVGGHAARLVVPETLVGLQAVLSALSSISAPVLILGNGSNVLISDRGVAGTVIKLGRGFADVSVVRDAELATPQAGAHHVVAGAALSVTRLLRFARKERLGGLACLGGVPATVGGAVRMNAGTKLGQLSEALVAAQLVTPNEAPRWVAATSLGLSYRRSELPAHAIVTAARFAAHDAQDSDFDALDEVLSYRKATQPLQLPSCGSVFANPTGDAAGRLIEAAELKGTAVGGAHVSELHANWIVNRGGATAADVHALVARCQREVAARFGIRLRPEVQLLGDWTDAEREEVRG